MSEAEIMAALNRMRSQLRKAHEAEAIAAMEEELAGSPVAPPLPSPYVGGLACAWELSEYGDAAVQQGCRREVQDEP